MWYVYRMPGRFVGWDLTHTVEQFLTAMHDDMDGEVSNSVIVHRGKEFLADLAVAQSTAKRVGWDGTVIGAVRVFTVAQFQGITYGFVWKQNHLGTTFVASPETLAYMHDDLDTDAYTDSEELERAKEALTGEKHTPEKPPSMFKTQPWRVSARGNSFRYVGSKHMATVFPSNKGGFSAIVSERDGLKKTFTRNFDTKEDCMDFVNDNIDDIVGSLK